MTFWYRTTKYGIDIEQVSVISCTNTFITVEYHDWNDQKKQRRISRKGTYDRYFPTFAEAIEYLLARTKQELADAKSSERQAISKIEKLMVMTEESCVIRQ